LGVVQYVWHGLFVGVLHLSPVLPEADHILQGFAVEVWRKGLACTKQAQKTQATAQPKAMGDGRHDDGIGTVKLFQHSLISKFQ
jgi:hypothetical protein